MTSKRAPPTTTTTTSARPRPPAAVPGGRSPRCSQPWTPPERAGPPVTLDATIRGRVPKVYGRRNGEGAAPTGRSPCEEPHPRRRPKAAGQAAAARAIRTRGASPQGPFPDGLREAGGLVKGEERVAVRYLDEPSLREEPGETTPV